MVLSCLAQTVAKKIPWALERAKSINLQFSMHLSLGYTHFQWCQVCKGRFVKFKTAELVAMLSSIPETVLYFLQQLQQIRK